MKVRKIKRTRILEFKESKWKEFGKSSRFYVQGKFFHEKGKPYLAISLLARSLWYGEHHKTYHLISKIYRELGEKEKSFAFLKKSYELSGVQDGIAVDYAEALVERGGKNEAIRVLNEVLHRNETFKRAKVILSTLKT